LNRHANFERIEISLLTLFRCATGESFNGIMHDVSSAEWGDNRLRCCPECGPIMRDWQGNEVIETSCGNTGWALFFMLTYILLMLYIVLSLAVGVILENFANVGSDNKKITIEMIEEFREVWLKYDPRGTFIVPSHNLLAILQQLKHPLGLAGKVPALSRAQMLYYLGELDIPDHKGYIHFMETLTAISHKHCGVTLPPCEATYKILRSLDKTPGVAKLEKPQHNALTNYLVSLLQSRWRGYAMRKKYSDDISEISGAEHQPNSNTGDNVSTSKHENSTPESLNKTENVAGTGKVKLSQVAPAPDTEPDNN